MKKISVREYWSKGRNRDNYDPYVLLSSANSLIPWKMGSSGYFIDVIFHFNGKIVFFEVYGNEDENSSTYCFKILKI
jgi:hypothetical protein